MTKALIGYSGFVGSNLLNQIKFDHQYNSKNINDIKGREFEEIYCAGAYATKWMANNNPSVDLQNIFHLLDNLRDVRADRFILISTIDVYKNLLNVNEENIIDLSNHHVYGVHRRIIENFVRERFVNHHIIRLPGLFGDGLKKNIIFDFLNNNQLKKINSNSKFQFYWLGNIAKDIKKIIANDIKLINLVTEPLIVKEIAEIVFKIKFENIVDENHVQYDVRTKYGKFFSQQIDQNYSNNYIQSKQEILQEMCDNIKIKSR
jgi:nucleoside-diphosphate-sugar epimerase